MSEKTWLIKHYLKIILVRDFTTMLKRHGSIKQPEDPQPHLASVRMLKRHGSIGTVLDWVTGALQQAYMSERPWLVAHRFLVSRR